MNLKTYILKDHEEEVIIYAHEKNSLVCEIEKLVETNNTSITGILDEDKILINPMDVSCFISENNRVYAMIKNDRYQVKQRLYQLEELLDNNFIKINQSCIVNIKKIKKFSSSIAGSIMITLNNGYTDYVARREIKNVKTRIGI